VTRGGERGGVQRGCGTQRGRGPAEQKPKRDGDGGVRATRETEWGREADRWAAPEGGAQP
jgi:hypothetical protein